MLKKNTRPKLRCTNHRKRILEISQKVKALHIGGSFSSVEILDTLFFEIMNKKDKFILSKGHCGILLYVILEAQKKLSKRQVNKYCMKNSELGVHPEITTRGVEASTGSLGHGIGIAAGLCLSRINKKKNNENIFVLMSDGELMEGSVWESVLFIAAKSINNLVVIVDNNNLQSATSNIDTHPNLMPIIKKFKAFGWECDVCDGHDSNDIKKKILKRNKSKPYALIAKTIKGNPVSFMKNVPIWHYRSPNKTELKKALNEIKNYEKRL
jgi:transketolase|tara:strand:+ start:476 stop:1279 length:804 start_codon:yes stop_codon:yes gene_type:complete